MEKNEAVHEIVHSFKKRHRPVRYAVSGHWTRYAIGRFSPPSAGSPRHQQVPHAFGRFPTSSQ